MSTMANFEPALAFLITCFAKSTILLASAWAIAIVLRQRSSAALRPLSIAPFM